STNGSTTSTNGSTGSTGSTTGRTGSTTGSTGSTTGSTGSTTGSGGNFTFAYASDATGLGKAYTIDSGGTGRAQLNTGSNEVTHVAMKNHSTKIAFVVWTTLKNILVMNANGSGLTQLTNDNWDTTGPSFSPDGSKILFTSYANGTAELWTMNV